MGGKLLLVISNSRLRSLSKNWENSIIAIGLRCSIRLHKSDSTLLNVPNVNILLECIN